MGRVSDHGAVTSRRYSWRGCQLSDSLVDVLEKKKNFCGELGTIPVVHDMSAEKAVGVRDRSGGYG